MQEANPSLAHMATELLDLYPYQIHEPRITAFGMVILSKYPFDETEKIQLFGNFAVRIKITIPEIGPVSLYALHTIPPLGPMRNNEIRTISELIAADDSKNILLMGDLNMTPYSPFFKKMLQTTGLRHQDTMAYPAVSWPAHFILPFLKIPIDHILFSDTFALIDKKTGPAMGSDHHSLIASFKLK